MVRIVNKSDFYRVIFFTLIVTVCSCSILRKDVGCKLLPESNEIIGGDKNAPILEVKKRYLMALVGDLFAVPHKNARYAFSNGYNIMKNPIFAGYRISGCPDTTSAKIMMANHLLNKYGYFRKDIIHLDTIYRIEIVNRDKLPIQNGNCDKTIIAVRKDSAELYSSINCLEWDSFFANIIDGFCDNHHCRPLEIPEGSGKMYLRKPVLLTVDHDVQGLQAYYEEEFGIRISQESIDSVDVILYKKLTDSP